MEQMTVQQVLHETIGIINKISVPVGMADQVARPLVGCVANLKECIRALDESAQKAEEPEAQSKDGEQAVESDG